MKLVVFDFDGTIADTNEAILRTFKRAAAENGVNCASDREIELSIGLHLRDMFRELCGVTDPELIKKCIDSYLTIFGEYYSCIKLYPGVSETMAQLKEKGIKVAIATNRGESSLTVLIKMLGIDVFVDKYVTPEYVKNVKPAPDMLEKLMADFGVTPEETLMVGDTTYDIEMGRKAGCHTCAVTYGSHPAARIAESRPERMIDTMTDLRHSVL